jgi:hypothetical protein
MELRVLFPAACKSTWYGRWGYGFGRAGFGIKPAAWKRAVSAVSGCCCWSPDWFRVAPKTVSPCPQRRPAW